MHSKRHGCFTLSRSRYCSKLLCAGRTLDVTACVQQTKSVAVGSIAACWHRRRCDRSSLFRSSTGDSPTPEVLIAATAWASSADSSETSDVAVRREAAQSVFCRAGKVWQHAWLVRPGKGKLFAVTPALYVHARLSTVARRRRSCDRCGTWSVRAIPRAILAISQ